MAWDQNLSDLRETLADLYRDRDDIERIVMDAGLAPGSISWSDKAINSWHNVLEEAQKHEKVQAIVDVARQEYPKRIQEWQERVQQIPSPSENALQVSLSSLPVTSSDLFGREQELARLDEAWEHPQTNIFVLVAWGGVGKTSLVNKWLFDNMAKGDYREAQRVFGWSFYSQGAAEGKQASADRFVADALRWFGDSNPNEGDPVDKGRRLAALIKEQKTLLVLDGLEPLQYPPGSEEGCLKDRGLCVMLRDLAAQNPGLCLITTRLSVNDLQTFFNSSVKNIRLTHLSPQAGAQVLSNLGVQGSEKELQKAVKDFDGHALALNLLGTYLSAVYDGDVRKRDKIAKLVYEDERQGKHAHWVMESYEHWFSETDKGRRELQILHIMGLFDRPADIDAIEALLKEPTIPGLTDDLSDGLHLPGGVHLSSSPAWKFAIKDLQDLRLIGAQAGMPADEADRMSAIQGVLDCHPLVREHFGEKLKQEQPDAWREAHSRLYDYYKNLPEKELPDTLEEMEPLFAAVAHGCLAGQHQEANDDVFFKRIKRENEYYIAHKLGAFGSFLATVSNFFEEVWSRPVAELDDATKALVLSQAGFGLRAVGRLREAAQPTQAGMELGAQQEDWENAASGAGTLSELWLTLGEVAQAVEAARQSVEFADRSGDLHQKMGSRTNLAEALHQQGEMSEAEILFQEVETMHEERSLVGPFLYGIWGFRFCDLLLTQGKYKIVQERANRTLKEWAKPGRVLLEIALDALSLGRAFLLQACPDINVRAARSSRLKPAMPDNQGDLSPDLAQAAHYLDQAVAGLRESGYQYHVPLGLLARAALFRKTQEFDKAWADLKEAQEIAARGEMRLFLTDYHLEAVRLMREELNVKRETWTVEDMQGHVAAAARLIEETGYHRRDGELEELQKMLDEYRS